jgi:hypothetical protein
MIPIFPALQHIDGINRNPSADVCTASSRALSSLLDMIDNDDHAPDSAATR